jgi:hypothetical protein
VRGYLRFLERPGRCDAVTLMANLWSCRALVIVSSPSVSGASYQVLTTANDQRSRQLFFAEERRVLKQQQRITREHIDEMHICLEQQLRRRHIVERLLCAQCNMNLRTEIRDVERDVVM